MSFSRLSIYRFSGFCSFMRLGRCSEVLTLQKASVNMTAQIRSRKIRSSQPQSITIK